jgi:hypothetical protein
LKQILKKISIIQEFIKSEFQKFELISKTNGREGVDFLIGENLLYLQFINLDTIERSIKISKQDLGELKDNLFIALVLIIEKEPRAIYFIPSKDLQESNSNFFVNNEVSLIPSLSNWEIKVSSNTIPELAKYALENMIDKLKV